MSVTVIPFAEGQSKLNWMDLIGAIAAGHDRPPAQVEDVLIYRGTDTLLNRSAWIDGMGIAVKACTIFPGNGAAGKPVVNGAVNLFADSDGALEAIVDFHLVTKWKTAGDSLLAATRLARPDSRNILIIGAGTVGRSLVEAYGSAFPGAGFTIWNRSAEGATRFAADCPGVIVVSDLEAAVRAADIVCCATMSATPILKGDWLSPGTHVDLIGAYRPDMREADDVVMQRGRVFVDAIGTTVEHIGELIEPIRSGALKVENVVADFRELERFVRTTDDEITVFKNGGGAHLDLMVSRYILDAWRAA